MGASHPYFAYVEIVRNYRWWDIFVLDVLGGEPIIAKAFGGLSGVGYPELQVFRVGAPLDTPLQKWDRKCWQRYPRYAHILSPTLSKWGAMKVRI